MRLGRRPTGEMLLIFLGAVAAAWVSNALAGPTRHLAWRTPPRPAALPSPTESVPSLPRKAPQPAPLPPLSSPASGPAPKVSTSQQTSPIAAPAPMSLQRAFPPPADGAPMEIDGAAAMALFKAGARFLDARRTVAFEAGHIRGALSLSVWEDGLDAKVQAFDATMKDPNDPVVLYCSGGSCRDSHDLAQQLWRLGYRNLRIYSGGWPEWQERGWPAAVGAEVQP